MIKHIHSWERVRGKKRLYKCSDPDCTTYVRKDLQAITMLGKKCLCWTCQAEHIITKYDLQLSKIICDKCRSRTKLKKDLPDLTELFPNSVEELGIKK
jgi:hypothetical protein